MRHSSLFFYRLKHTYNSSKRLLRVRKHQGERGSFKHNPQADAVSSRVPSGILRSSNISGSAAFVLMTSAAVVEGLVFAISDEFTTDRVGNGDPE